MDFEEFDIKLLKKYASFLSSKKLGEVINYFHLKNLAEITEYNQFSFTQASELLETEIISFLKALENGTIQEEINNWISNSVKKEIEFSFQLISNRKVVLMEFINDYTNDTITSNSIAIAIEYIFSFQENLVTSLHNEKISSLIKIEDELTDGISRLRNILDHTPIHINVYDLEMDRSIFNNGAGKILFGHSPEQVMDEKFSELWISKVHPNDKLKVKKRIKNFKRLKDEDIDQIEYRMIDKKGNIVWYYSRASVFKRVNGKVKQILLNGLNITDLKNSEEKRRYITAQLKEAQKFAHIGNFDWDIKNDIINYTDEVYKIYGLPSNKKKFKISDFKSRLKKDSVKKFENDLVHAFKDIKNERYEGEYRIVLPDKTEKDIFSRAKIIRNSNGKPIRLQGTVMDITSVKKTEYVLIEKNKEITTINKKLEESRKEIKKINKELENRINVRTKELKENEMEYKFLAKNVPHLFWTTLPEGGMDFHNKNIYKYTGANYEQLKEWKWEDFIHPEDLDKVVTARMKSLEKGEIFEDEFRIKRYDGVYRWHLGRSVPFKNKEGEIIKWMGSAVDIDEQKKYAEELKIKNEQLTRTNNDLDNFIYTASHDLKAPISNIEGLINALSAEMSENCKSEGDNLKILKMVNGSIQMFKHTIQGLTEITHAQKSGEESMQDNNLNDLLDEVKSILEDQIKISDSDITADFKNCNTIKFSRKNLKSILYNLLSNAIKFRSPDRTPQIFITTQCHDDYIELSIQDNGLGFDPKQKSKAFEMFRRLHSHTEGSGVGLYIVKRIITNAGGKIDVESKKGKGSVFRVCFKI